MRPNNWEDESYNNIKEESTESLVIRLRIFNWFKIKF